jgi:hypothetical protein
MTRSIQYDLGSENLKALDVPDWKRRVKNVRSSCVQKLHKIGLQTTESVLIVPECREDKIDGVVEWVQGKYANLIKGLAQEGASKELLEALEPIIAVDHLTGEQTKSKKKLAERAMIKKLNEALDCATKLQERLEGILSPEARHNALLNVSEQIENWENISSIADNLGLYLPESKNQLLKLLEEAKAKVGE